MKYGSIIEMCLKHGLVPKPVATHYLFSSVVVPSLMILSTGNSLAVAQRSKCLYL